MRALIGVALVLLVMVVAGDARSSPTATVERHAICWHPTNRVSHQHWRIWPSRDTGFPCKQLFEKGYAVITPFGIAGFHRQRTFGNLPDPNGGQP